jgi:mRNA-degrading endonuclease RelE of RelBE toxin-antitoxin system
MNWAVELSASAIKELKKLPRDRQGQIGRAIDEMESDPLAGDMIPLKGDEWRGITASGWEATGSSSHWIARP